MNQLALAAAAFVIAHVGLSSTPLRGWIVGRVGEGPYRGIFSLLAFVTLIWLIVAYRAAPGQPLWDTAGWQHVPIVIMPVALLLLVCGVWGANPTSAGQEALLEKGPEARGMLRITRHPLQLAIALWALAHVAANGDEAALWFFGAFAVLSIGGTLLQERRKAAQFEKGWQTFATSTSLVPFLAILQGRNRFVAGEIGWARLAVALVLYVLLIGIHPLLFGARPY